MLSYKEFGLPDIKKILYLTHADPLLYHIPKDILGMIAKCYDMMASRLYITVHVHMMGAGYVQKIYHKDTHISQICADFENMDIIARGRMFSPNDKGTLRTFGIQDGDRFVVAMRIRGY